MKIMIPKKVLIGNDPWSTDLLDFIKSGPHYLTAQQWQENIDIPLESTFYYKWLMSMFIADNVVWGGILKNEDDIVKQCARYRAMYLIAPKWLEEYSILQTDTNSAHYYGYRPVKVRCNGAIDIWDGMHRISLLTFKRLPIEVTICERLPGWAELYKEIEDLYPNKMLYQPIPHPDFSDWATAIDGNKEQIICDFFKQNKIDSVLDLGTCHGFTLYKLKDLIKHGIGIESDKIRFQIASILLNKIGFSCHNTNAIDYIETSESADCTLCLAILHHISRLCPIEVFEKFLQTVAQKTKFIIYTLPNPNEDQFSWMYESKRDNFDEYILQLTGFKTREVIVSSREIRILEKNL